MVDYVANRIAVALKRANQEETASIEVLKYSIHILLNPLITVILSLLIASVFDKTTEVIIVLISFALLRAFSGGYHFEKTEVCILFTTALAITLSFASFSVPVIIGLTGASIILVLIYAPYSKVRNTLIPAKFDPYLKLISLVIVCSNFFFLSSLLSASFLFQALTLITVRKG